LLEIDPAKQQATVKSQQDARAAQQANLSWAQQQYDRISGLASAGVVSKQDLDQAKANLDAAKAQLSSLDAQVNEQQVQLHYYEVVAPGPGIVGDIPVRVGDRVTTSTTLTTVDKPGTLELYVYVPIERSPQLKTNMPVEILDGESNVIGDSRIFFISPQVDSTTQTVLVKARIANGKDSLRQFQFIRARVIWGTQRNPVVPILSVSRIGAQYFVFVAEPDKNGAYVARQRPLKIGQIAGNDYVVLDGIKPGDKVVVSGTQFLVDGAPIAPQETSG
jgi:RND family efflux transporter MFP subunit